MRLTTVPPAARVLRSAAAFTDRLGRLIQRAQGDDHLFVSPLGPFRFGEASLSLPRFVFFGPNTTDESWRIAFRAGLDASDLRASAALLGFIESLATQCQVGHGLNLTFFPVVDVAGVWSRASARGLGAAAWTSHAAPELVLLQSDARLAGYRSFVRVETAAPGEDVIGLRLRTPAGVEGSPDVELLSSDDFESFPVHFEHAGLAPTPRDGPLSMTPPLAGDPFELTLRVPANWTDDVYQRAVNSVLMRFVLRYRAFQAYGQHL